MTEAQQWLDLALQQITAESYLDDLNFEDERSVKDRLKLGANNYRVPINEENPHSTRMTDLQADYFWDHFEIIDHLPNRSSGFSATLTRNKQTGEYTLSFRSTEFRLPEEGGDKYRDGLYADGRIGTHGFAFAQLASMEDYYAWLKSSGTLPDNAVLNVTGYSLGGHMATIFTELHADEVNNTYSFNAVGRGDYFKSVGTIGNMIADYRGRLISDPPAEGLPADVFDVKADITLVPGRQLSIYTDKEGSASLYVKDKYSADGSALIDLLEITQGIDAPKLAPEINDKILQIHGRANQSDIEVVANGGVSSSNRAPVYIEDQPEKDPADFGTTHSIILIVDSLIMTDLLQTIDPTLTRQDTESIFAIASNTKASSVSIGQDGRVEHDSLEKVLDGLRRVFIGSNVSDTRSINETGSYGDIELRNRFHGNVDSLRKILGENLYKIERLDTKSTPEIIDVASTDTQQGLAYRHTLTQLDPFAVVGGPGLHDANMLSVDKFSPQYLTDRAMFLSTLLFSNRGNLGGDDPAQRHINSFIGTPKIIDRYQNGQKTFGLNVKSVDPSDSFDPPLISIKPAGSNVAVDPDATHFQFVEDGIDTKLRGSERIDHLFGGSGNDTINGFSNDDYLEGGLGNDRLDGGTGSDRLVGGDGQDTLDGGRGDDQLDGGLGHDIYVYDSQLGGVDTILDKDGIGVIQWDGLVLNGGKKRSDSSYVDNNNQIKYEFDPGANGRGTLTITDGRGKLRVLDFTNGALGISLQQTPAQEPHSVDQLGGSIYGDPLISHNPAANNKLIGSHAGDDLNGKAGNDVLLGGDGGDWIHAGSGDDLIFGGDGNDRIFTGAGQDKVAAGGGDDIVISKTNFGFHSQLDQQHAPVYSNWNLDATNIWRHGWRNAEVKYHGLVASNNGHYEFNLSPIYRDIASSGQPFDVASQRFEYIHESNSVARLKISSALFSAVDQYRLTFTREDNTDLSAQTIDGGAGNDILAGNAGIDVLIGGSGDDRLAGYEGSDDLFGGAGKDEIYGGLGNDLLDGGADQDLIVGEAGADKLYGGQGNDTLWGDSDILPDRLHGNDFLDGGAGQDTLYGGHGDDSLSGGSGNDTLWGDAGNDQLTGGDGNDLLHGDDHETPFTLHGHDVLNGGDGEDKLFGFGGDDVLQGGKGNDELIGGDGADQLDAGDGDDKLWGGPGDDRLLGGAGNDLLHGNAGNDILFGGAGNDRLSGGSGVDTFVFRSGDGLDVIDDADGFDRIHFEDASSQSFNTWVVNTKEGDRYLALNYGNSDTVFIKDGLHGAIQKFHYGERGVLDIQDLIGNTFTQPLDHRLPSSGTAYGGKADDQLLGSAGVDTLYGGLGNDTLAGGAGADTLVGGIGNDIYVFGRGGGTDTVIEQAGESNTIRLWANASLSDLSAEKQGHDLFLHLDGTQDGLLIENYFAAPQDWRVESHDGQVTLLSSIQTKTKNKFEQFESVDKAKASYKNEVQNFYTGALIVNGYFESTPGVYRKTEIRSGISAGTLKQENIFHYELAVEFRSESDDAPEIFRTSPNLDTTSIFQGKTTRSETSSTLDTTGAVFSKSDPSEGVLVDLDQLQVRNGSGINLAVGSVEPVYGTSSSLNPLTGIYERDVLGYWVFGSSAGARYLTQHIERQRGESKVSGSLVVEEIIAGAGNNLVTGTQNNAHTAGLFNLLDGGAGDDVLRVSPGNPTADTPLLVPGGDASGLLNVPGSFLYGNQGDDKLVGSRHNDVLIGGSGNDQMRGGLGNDRYLIYHGDGQDVIFDDGHRISGVRDEDVIQLPHGVELNDLSFEWGEVVTDAPHAGSNWPGRTESLHTSLTMSWSTDDRLTVILPHSELGAGLGIDYVEFSDGSRVAFQDIIERAGANPGLDPHLRDNVLAGDGNLFGGAGDDHLTSTSHPQSNVHSGLPILLPETSVDVDAPRLIGGSGHDVLVGSNADDQLFGGSIVYTTLADLPFAVGGLWDEGNQFRGNAGDDVIWTTAGADLIHFGLGDGIDRITDLYHHRYFPPGEIGSGPALGDSRLNQLFPELQDPAALLPGHKNQILQNKDVVRFDSGIALENIDFVRRDNDLFLRVEGTEGLLFENWYSAEFNQFDKIEFADGTIIEGVQLQQLIAGENINLGPRVQEALKNWEIKAQSTADIVIPDDTFSFDSGAPVQQFFATLADGSSLPEWLTFDPALRKFTALPDTNDVGNYEIVLTAVDSQGRSVTDSFSLTIAQSNRAPTLNLDNVVTDEDQAVAIAANVLLANDFDADGDNLTVVAVNNPQNGTVELNKSGEIVFTPAENFNGLGQFEYMVDDGAGGRSTQTVNVQIAPVNDAPFVNVPIDPKTIYARKPFEFSLPNSIFEEHDQADSIRIGASLEGGRPLPNWLKFDSQSRVFKGIATRFDVGELNVELTAYDSYGASASTTFELTVEQGQGSFVPRLNKYVRRARHVLSKNQDRTRTGVGDDMLFGFAGDDNLDGGPGEDRVWGGAGHDQLWGGLGNDVLFGNQGRDQLDGGPNDDQLYGGTGNDILAGGVGSDSLMGGLGSDQYLYSRGDGQDVIWESAQPQRADTDTVTFSTGIDHNQLWFSRNNNDLQVSVVGTTDQLSIKDWYAGKDRKVELFESGDGFSATSQQVDLLVQAMAAFDPPASGTLNLSAGLHDQLESVIAVNWESG